MRLELGLELGLGFCLEVRLGLDFIVRVSVGLGWLKGCG